MRSREKKAYIEKARDYFPEIRFEDTQLIKSGWDHDVLVLDDRHVFRFPKKDLPTKYRAKFRAEVQLLAYLAPRVALSR